MCSRAQTVAAASLATHLRNVPRLRSVLIVHPDPVTGKELGQALAWGPGAGRNDVAVVSTFEAARAILQSRPPALLVTPVALGEYNGLHLVYLAKTIVQYTRSIVHTVLP